MFGYQTDYAIFFCYNFTIVLFNTIIYLRSLFTEFFYLSIFMFFTKVPRITISFTWRIIRTTSVLISITNVVLLIFKRCRYFYLIIIFLHQVYYPQVFKHWIYWGQKDPIQNYMHILLSMDSLTSIHLSLLHR